VVTIGAGGTVELLPGLSGNGIINLNGGTLSSASNNDFNGSINVSAGTVEAKNNDALGSAILTLAGSANAITLALTDAVTFNNAVIDLGGGTVNVTGSLIVSKQVLISSSTVLDPLGGTVKLTAGIGGLSTLTVGGSGDLELGSTLDTTVNVVPHGTVTLLPGLVGATNVHNMGGTVN
jgi:hypothetical protein